MVLTPSTMMPLGTKTPDFHLPDVVSGKTISLDDFSAKKVLLVIFLCRHCPYVKHVQQELAKLGRDYGLKDVAMVGISSNDTDKYPEDSPSSLREMVLELKLNFPFCFDETQEIAKAFHAACTPEFYVFNGERKLAYRGQLDDSRPKNNIPVTGKDLRAALDAVLKDQPVSAEQRPGIGCNIKWKPGNEPDYFLTPASK
jgi:peroxiredoxin